MRNIVRHLPLAAALTLALGTGRAWAEYAVVFNGPQANFETSSLGGVEGFEFTPSADLTVTSLGWNDLNNSNPSGGPDGFLAPHAVGIYRFSDHALVTSVTLPAGTAAPLADGFFRYGDVAPVVLTAGTTYVLAATTNGFVGGTSVIESTQNRTLGVDALIDPLITTGAWLLGPTTNPSGLEFPSLVIDSNPTVLPFGPNFQFTTPAAVPEPSSMALLGTGLLAVLVHACRRRGQAASTAV